MGEHGPGELGRTNHDSGEHDQGTMVGRTGTRRIWSRANMVSGEHGLGRTWPRANMVSNEPGLGEQGRANMVGRTWTGEHGLLDQPSAI